MIFHENRLLADDSYEISDLIYVENKERFAKLSSAAVVLKLGLDATKSVFGVSDRVTLKPVSSATESS